MIWLESSTKEVTAEIIYHIKVGKENGDILRWPQVNWDKGRRMMTKTTRLGLNPRHKASISFKTVKENIDESCRGIKNVEM